MLKIIQKKWYEFFYKAYNKEYEVGEVDVKNEEKN